LISVGSAVGRPGFTKLKAALPRLPAQHIVIETDAPDEEGSEPASLATVAQQVATAIGRHDLDARALLASSTANLSRCFAINVAFI